MEQQEEYERNQNAFKEIAAKIRVETPGDLFAVTTSKMLRFHGVSL